MKKSTKAILGAIALTEALYVFLSPRVATKLYHSKLFRHDEGQGPEPLLSNFTEVENREVSLRSADGKQLRGWFFKHPTSKKVFLYCMGRSSDIPKCLEYIRMLLDSGASVFVYEYRGFGKSEGKPSVRGIVEDGVAAFDCLVQRLGYAGKDIVLYGESLGGGVATYISKVRPAAGVALQSTYASLERIGKEMVPALRVYPRVLFPRPLLDNEWELKTNTLPLLIIHGVHDDVIPYRHAERLWNAASGPKHPILRLENTTHRFIDLTDRTPFVRGLAAFLASLDNQPGAPPSARRAGEAEERHPVVTG